MGKVLEIATLLIFRSNAYTWRGGLKLQGDGCPIGLDLSGEIGRLETAETDITISLKCEENDIQVDLSKRYVDDKTDILGSIPFGYRWCDGQVQFNNKWIEEDQHIPVDKHTCNVLTGLCNSTMPSIQFVGAVASDYPDEHVPILDMAVCMIEMTEPADENTPKFSYPQVEYKFFKKKMARQTVMKASSAMPEGIKRETLVNEMIRRLANTSLDQPNTTKNTVEAVNDFMVAMKLSGYTEKVRRETAVAGFKGFNRKVFEAKSLNKPLHRHMEEGASLRHKSKISLKANWFNKKRENGSKFHQETEVPSFIPRPRRKPREAIPAKPVSTQDSRQVDNVIFIPYTQKGDLRKRLQEVDDNITKMMGVGRTKYVERAGLAFHSQLVNKNVWQALLGGCGRPHCYVCKFSGGKGISCRSESVCYQMTCSLCEKEGRRIIYIGETSRSSMERIYEHMWLFKMRKEGNPELNEANSVLWNHSKSTHNSTMTTSHWKVEVTSSHKTPLSRQITEAVRISKEPKANLLNSKNEFAANNLPEIALQYGSQIVTATQMRGGRMMKRKPSKSSTKTWK